MSAAAKNFSALPSFGGFKVVIKKIERLDKCFNSCFIVVDSNTWIGFHS
jgi:hypothetical protein